MKYSEQQLKYTQQDDPKRQKWMRTEYDAWLNAPTPIKTVDDLKKELQKAITLELSTIPPYLCALYSIQDGTNEFPAFIIRSVVVEEMLHMILVANILNAIGGTNEIQEMTLKKNIPVYPSPMPYSEKEDFSIPLQKFSLDAIDTFMEIEKPAKDWGPSKGKPKSIGQFYANICYALVQLNATHGNIFIGDPERQVTPEHYYGAGGKLTPVHSLKDAQRAMEEIVGQGEGLDGSLTDGAAGAFGQKIEVAHYYRFNEIKMKKYYDKEDTAQKPPSGADLAVDYEKVYDMELNPKMKNYADRRDLHDKAKAFNKTYMDLLRNIQESCDGKPEKLMQGIPLMYDLKYKATELMKIPVGKDGRYMAGPSFEYIDKY